METYVIIDIMDGTPAIAVFKHMLNTIPFEPPLIAYIGDAQIRIHVPAEGLNTSLKALRAAANDVSKNEVSLADVYFDTNEKVVYEFL